MTGYLAAHTPHTMYATFSPIPQRNAFSASGAYRSVGMETGVSAASPHKLVAMLFDGLQESLAQAIGALQSKDLDAKCRALGRAIRIVDEGLRAGLDVTRGGALARNLDDLYAYVTLRLTQANLRSDAEAVAECQRLIDPVAKAWSAIEPGRFAA